jgi:hypothetical protein
VPHHWGVPSTSAESVRNALSLLQRDIADGRPVLEARLLDAGGQVEAATLESLRRLDRDGTPFHLAFSQVAIEQDDEWLLLLAEVVGRVQHADTPEALRAAAWSVDTLLVTVTRSGFRR